LFESELFGHEKGAFTGAIARKPGKLELVGDGTLFLDEVAELPTNCQAKLLTAIEDRVFERVGGTQRLEFRGRVLAATNRDIQNEMKAGSFRKDLFYRLSAYRLLLPPLRERSADIPLFIEWGLNRSNSKFRKSVDDPDEKTLTKLASYAWPGNVRELLHHVERVALFATGSSTDRSLWLSLPTDLTVMTQMEPDDLREAMEDFRKRHVLRVLDNCGGNQTEAARLLGIERTHLNRLVAQFQGRR
jgi:transcriptional regulator with GAF, ATPase, and Fis domain